MWKETGGGQFSQKEMGAPFLRERGMDARTANSAVQPFLLQPRAPRILSAFGTHIMVFISRPPRHSRKDQKMNEQRGTFDLFHTENNNHLKLSIYAFIGFCVPGQL
jgi:hypothetical protein